MTEIQHDVMLTVDQYATQENKSYRTVMRWLAERRVPGAVKDPTSGEWSIPASSRPGSAPLALHTPAPFPDNTGTMTMHPSRLGSTALTVVDDDPPELADVPLLEELADMPAFLTVSQAARYLGVPQAQILANPARFGAEAIGTQGSLRVPQRVVRQIAGL